MATKSSEIFVWLKEISNGLNLERLAEEFEKRGFITCQSSKYILKNDLDAFFPSPQKLLLAEKRILEAEIENLKVSKEYLRPRELFSQTDGYGASQTSRVHGHSNNVKKMFKKFCAIKKLFCSKRAVPFTKNFKKKK